MTFDAEGGAFINSLLDVMLFEVINGNIDGNAYIEHSPPTWAGPENYVFVGWSYTKYNTADPKTLFNRPINFFHPATTSQVFLGAVTVYAVWKEVDIFTVTFWPNGGEWPDGSADPIEIETDDYGLVAYVPYSYEPIHPVKDGFTFIGWNTAIDGSGELFRPDIEVMENIIVYARWKSNDPGALEVIFKLNGAIGFDFSEWITLNNSVGEPPEPTWEEHSFTGWYTDPTCQDRWDFNTLINSPTTLYAGWSTYGDVYWVAYDPGVHGTWSVSSQNVTSSLGASTPGFSGNPASMSDDSEWSFDGWLPAVASTVTGNATYVAQWVKDVVENEFTLSYWDNDAYSGVVPVDSMWYVVGDVVTVLGQGSLVRDGYSFLGWSTNPAATIATYTVGSTFTMQNGVVVLYAVWSQNFYSVTYQSGVHGTFTPQTTTGLRYGADTPAAPTVTGEVGWTFTGWTPVPYATVTGDATYVAQWTQTATSIVSPAPSATAAPTSTPNSGTASPPSVHTTPALTPTTIPTFTPPGGTHDVYSGVVVWAVVNLLIAVAGVVLVVVVALLFKRKQQNGKQKTVHSADEDKTVRKRNVLWLMLAVVLAIVGVVVFLLTEDLSLPFGWVTDKWTILNAVILVVEGITIWLYLKTSKKVANK